MQKFLFPFFFLFFWQMQVVYGQSSLYKSPDLKTYQAQHKTVAILPFDVSIQLRRLPKRMTMEDVKDQEKQASFDFQQSLQTYLLRQEGRGKYTVNFQDIAKTNRILGENNISPETIKTVSREDLAKLLGVDAVLTGRIITTRPFTIGEAIASDVLLGLPLRTHQVDAFISINDGQTGNLIWRYMREVGGSYLSNTDNMIDFIMRRSSKRFAYKK